MYKLISIHIEVCQILLHRIYLTHLTRQTENILNEDNIQQYLRLNDRVKTIFVTISRNAQSLHPNPL